MLTTLSLSVLVCDGAPPERAVNMKLAPLIPAETPYLFGHLSAWREEDSQALWRYWRANESERVTAWEQLLSKLDGEQSKELSALRERLQLPSDRAGWRSVGIERLPEVAFYGTGLIPTLAFTVDERRLFSDWVKAQLQGVTYGFESRAHPRGYYWRRAFKRWTLIIKLSPLGEGPAGVIQVSLLPRSAEPVLLSDVLSPPARPLTADTLKERLLVFGEEIEPTGWIDLHGVLSSLLGSAPPALAQSARALSLPLPAQLTGACAGELVAVSSTFPLISLGASPSQETIETLFHLSPEALSLLSGLALPHDAFPEDAEEARPALAARVSLNPLGVEPLLRRLAQWRRAPWSCPIIKSLNRLALSSETIDQLPIFKMFTGHIRGLEVHLSELPSEGRQALKGWVALRSMQPELLWGAIQAMGERAPRWLQGVQLDAKGSAVQLKETPSSWPAPALSSSTGGGLILSFDQASLESGLHPRTHAFFKAQGDPLLVTGSQRSSSASVLTLRYRSDTAERVRDLFQEFKDRAERVARRAHASASEQATQQATQPSTSTRSRQAGQTNASATKDAKVEKVKGKTLYRQISLIPNVKGLTLRVRELPSEIGDKKH